jgi:glycosyltransferase involved in cell wall biosynthesis
MSRLLPHMKRIWRGMPVSPMVRTILGTPVWHILTARGRANLQRLSDPAIIPPGPLVISACISDRTGIGRAGRLTVKAAEAWGVPVIVHDIAGDPHMHRVPRDLPTGGVWIAHCNPPEAAVVMSQASEHLWATRYRIGYWAYELSELPRFWQSAIPFFHEIWTPSQFVADAVERARGGASTIVRVVPHPIVVDPPADVLPRTGGPLTFLVMADARSSFARKNPPGAVQAFQQAFTPDDSGVRLAVKITAAWKDPRAVAGLRGAAAGWPNIRFIEDDLSDAETQSLVASADCLVSLHRAEGFGLPIAEAMLAGLPVIATDWSGNTDLTRGASYEVPYSLVPAVDPSGRYSGTRQQWADPDLAAAAAAMRRVRDDPAGRAAIARSGQRRVRELCAGLPPDAIAALIGPAPAFVADRRQVTTKGTDE